MPISGIVIRCMPHLTEAISASLTEQDIVEIHGNLPDGKLIAVIDTDSVEAEMAVVNQLLATEGVIDVQLAYHNFEDTNVPDVGDRQHLNREG